MAGTEGVVLGPCPSSKRKASAAELEEGLSDGGNAAGYATAAPAEAVSDEALPGSPAPADLEAPRRRPKAVMSEAWIESVLADEVKPLPFTERLLKNPVLAEIFRSHEQFRARYAGYQAWVRRELETKGYVEVDDDYEERCDLLQAVSTAAFYGREKEEKEALDKLAALRR